MYDLMSASLIKIWRKAYKISGKILANTLFEDSARCSLFVKLKFSLLAFSIVRRICVLPTICHCSYCSLIKHVMWINNLHITRLHFYFPQLTYADITFFDFSNSILAQGKPEAPEQLSKFPKLVEHYNSVLKNPGIKDWVERRPKSDF